MRSLVIAIISVGIGLAGLILTFGIFLASGQQQTQEQIREVQEQIRLLSERVASLEPAIRFLHPSPASDAK